MPAIMQLLFISGIKMKKNLIFAVVIIIASFAVYFNSLQNEFLWDDKVLISENETIKDWKYTKEAFTTHLYHGSQNASNFYRPILKLSFMLDWQLWGKNVVGWHLTNIILHTTNALLIFFLFSLILKDKIASFIMAMFFAVHPLFTSAVTYISGRADPLALFFMLISFLLFTKSRYALSLLFFIFAILTKETAIILPLLLFAYGRKGDCPRRGLSPFLFVCIIYGILRFTVLNFPYVPTLTGDSVLSLRLATMVKIIFIYLKLLVLPFGLHMERNVPYVKSFLEPEVMLSVIGLVLLGYLVYKRRHKEGFFGIMWFFIALLPVSNIKPLNMSMAEHWMYVPAIGLFSCVGLVSARLMQRSLARRIALWSFFLAVILFFSTLTIAQNRIWKNDKVFYDYFLKYVPDSYVGRTNMGNIYSREGKIGMAIREYKKALEICPHYTAAHYNLARRYFQLRERNKAAWHIERALAYFPTLAESYYWLGILYEYNEKCVWHGAGFEREKAAAAYRKALKIDPQYRAARNNLRILDSEAPGRYNRSK